MLVAVAVLVSDVSDARDGNDLPEVEVSLGPEAFPVLSSLMRTPQRR